MVKLMQSKIKRNLILQLSYMCIVFMSHLFSPDIHAGSNPKQTVQLQKQESPMLLIRKADERGSSEHGWLKSAFTFSFADYYDPKFMNFRTLRVINEDIIKGGKGFDSHPHDNMEIITYVMSGALQHKDSMGNTSIIRPGEVQRMSAGTGIVHSEYNYEKDKETHLYQIWIVPSKKGIKPSYAQKSFEDKLKTNQLVLVVSQNAREGSIGIEQDADLYLAKLEKDGSLNFAVRPNRHIWVQMIKGTMTVNGQEISAGDGLNTGSDNRNPAAENPTVLSFLAKENAEFMLFDLK